MKNVCVLAYYNTIVTILVYFSGDLNLYKISASNILIFVTTI